MFKFVLICLSIFAFYTQYNVQHYIPLGMKVYRGWPRCCAILSVATDSAMRFKGN